MFTLTTASYCTLQWGDFLLHITLFFTGRGENLCHAGLLPWWLPVLCSWIMQHSGSLDYNAWQWQWCRNSEYFIPGAQIQFKILQLGCCYSLRSSPRLNLVFPADGDDENYRGGECWYVDRLIVWHKPIKKHVPNDTRKMLCCEAGATMTSWGAGVLYKNDSSLL